MHSRAQARERRGVASERGSLLMWAFAIDIAMLTLIIGYFPFFQTILRATQSFPQTQAMMLAEAGIERALWAFNSPTINSDPGNPTNWANDIPGNGWANITFTQKCVDLAAGWSQPTCYQRTFLDLQYDLPGNNPNGGIAGDVRVTVLQPISTEPRVVAEAVYAPGLVANGDSFAAGNDATKQRVRAILVRDIPTFDYAVYGGNSVAIDPSGDAGSVVVDSYADTVQADVDKDGGADTDDNNFVTARFGCYIGQPCWTTVYGYDVFGNPLKGQDADVNNDNSVDTSDISWMVSCMNGDPSCFQRTWGSNGHVGVYEKSPADASTDLEIGPGSTVKGNLYRSDDASLVINGTYTGSLITRRKPTMPDIVVPSALQACAGTAIALTVTNGQTISLSGDKCYTTITVQENGVLQLAPNTRLYVTSTAGWPQLMVWPSVGGSGSPSGKIEVQGMAKIYMEGSFDVETWAGQTGQGVVHTYAGQKRPVNFQLYAKGLNAGGFSQISQNNFYGMVYQKNKIVFAECYEDCHFYGSIISDNTVLVRNLTGGRITQFHYDEYLKNLALNGSGWVPLTTTVPYPFARYRIKSWQR